MGRPDLPTRPDLTATRPTTPLARTAADLAAALATIARQIAAPGAVRVDGWTILPDPDTGGVRYVNAPGTLSGTAADPLEARALIRAEDDATHEATTLPHADPAWDRWHDDTEDRRRDAREEDAAVEAAWRRG